MLSRYRLTTRFFGLALILVLLASTSLLVQGAQARLFALVHPGESIDSALLEQIDVLVPTGWHIAADGSLAGDIAEGIDSSSWAYQVMPLVGNTAPNGEAFALDNAAANVDAIDALVARLDEAGFEGALLDFRFDAEAAGAFTEMVELLAAPTFADAGLSLGVVVQADRLDSHDLAALGERVNLVFLQDFAPQGPALDTLTEAIAPGKAGILISAMSIDQSDAGAIQVGYRQALAPFGKLQPVSDNLKGDKILSPGEPFSAQLEATETALTLDEASNAITYTYPGPEGGDHTVWVSTPAYLFGRLKSASQNGLAAVALDGLFHQDAAPGLAGSFQAYHAGADALETPAALDLVWQISAPNGSTIAAEPYTGTPFESSLGETGEYAVNIGMQYGSDPDTFASLDQIAFIVAGEAAAAPTEAPPATEAAAPTDVPMPTTERLPADKPTPTQAVETPIPDALAVAPGPENLNLRDGPGTNYEVVGTLAPGQGAAVVGRTLPAEANEGVWLLVDTQGQLAWVAYWVVQFQGDLNDISVYNATAIQEGVVTPASVAGASPPAATPTPAPAEAGAETPAPTQPAADVSIPEGAAAVAVVNTGGGSLNVRSGPSIFFDQLGKLAQGQAVAILGRTEGDQAWYKIDYNGQEGWIAGWLTQTEGDLLAVEVIASEEAPPLPEGAEAPPEAPVFTGGSAAVGGFELGGQVPGGVGSAAGYMQRAGMTWVKMQLRYTVGQSPGSAAGMINDAHGSGFKILLTILGSPEDMTHHGFDAYLQEYANFAGGVASLAPDGIEVWNEMNIDREWPTGQIDPAMYTRLLAAAYNAIKSVNPNILVVSGAPAPTGAEGAFGTDRVWNDSRYLQGLSAAGATAYMDCVGAHYNEGIVPPSWSSGDPRDGYYTRYLPGMINVYSQLGKPICFTELGYLTPEGYGTLPGGFAWAQQVTLAQQAAWLAEAAVVCANSGVRLMIVWNVNYSGGGADPMGGYAIVRPDGSCPACDALGAAMR